jgi:hypothetical protein
LSMLLSEVGAQSFMDKQEEKEEKGPFGTA